MVYYNMVYYNMIWYLIVGAPNSEPLDSHDNQYPFKALRIRLDEASGPKDYVVQGCWATLSLRVWELLKATVPNMGRNIVTLGTQVLGLSPYDGSSWRHELGSRFRGPKDKNPR